MIIQASYLAIGRYFRLKTTNGERFRLAKTLGFLFT
jgi:hypothetical protein